MRFERLRLEVTEVLGEGASLMVIKQSRKTGSLDLLKNVLTHKSLFLQCLKNLR